MHSPLPSLLISCRILLTLPEACPSGSVVVRWDTLNNKIPPGFNKSRKSFNCVNQIDIKFPLSTNQAKFNQLYILGISWKHIYPNRRRPLKIGHHLYKNIKLLYSPVYNQHPELSVIVFQTSVIKSRNGTMKLPQFKIARNQQPKVLQTLLKLSRVLTCKHSCGTWPGFIADPITTTS